jgi:hypothetical protein
MIVFGSEEIGSLLELIKKFKCTPVVTGVV